MSRKQEHSRKPDSVYDLVERCSPGPYCELFSRKRMPGWSQWGDEADGARLHANTCRAVLQ